MFPCIHAINSVVAPRFPGRYLHLPANPLSKPSSVLSCAPVLPIRQPWNSSMHYRTSRASFESPYVSMPLCPALSAFRCTMRRSHCKSPLRTNMEFYRVLSGADNYAVLGWWWLTLSDDRDRVSKGDLVLIPIRLMNRSTEIWGEDANEFRYAQVTLSIILYGLTAGTL